MKKSLLFLFAFAALACSKNHSSADSDPPLKKAELSYVMPLDSVRALALKLPATFSDNPQTKSSGKLIKEIVPFSNFSKASKTRSVDSNVPSLDDVYVVNYENGEGFAIICADKRLPDVLGYSDSGSISDTLSNPGMVMVMELIPGFVATRGVNYPPIIIDTTHKWLELYPYDSNGQWGEYGTPVLAKINTRWGQEKPFNNKLPACNTEDNKLTGCVPTAIIQIMSYHRNMSSVNGVTLDWDILNLLKYPTDFYIYTAGINAQNSISTLFKYVGDKLGTIYGCSVSSTLSNNIINNLSWFSLRSDGLVTYTPQLVKQNINNGLPVYARGASTNGTGHAWVIDAYRETSRQNTHYEPRVPTTQFRQPWYIETVSTEYNTMFWCNWGWDGVSNGYFLGDLFYTERGFDKESSAPGPDLYFDKVNMQIINNLRPL